MIRPRILLTRRWPYAVERHLNERYDLVVDADDRPLRQDELRDAMFAFDAICPTVSDRIDAEVIGAGGARVRLIGNYGVGVNHIDLPAAARAGILVTNTPDVLTDTTADLALMLMLMAARRAGEGERELRAGLWSGWRPTHLLGCDLTGKTLGLIGFGRIAQATARRAHAGFGMRILYFSRSAASPEKEAMTAASRCDTLEQLLKESDIVSLHAPGGAATHHLINAASIAQMKSGVILINTARGTLIDEQALASALQAGTIRAAGLDVYEEEPAVDSALLALENVVLLPHLGSATEETRVAMGRRVARNLDAFFDGLPPPDRA